MGKRQVVKLTAFLSDSQLERAAKLANLALGQYWDCSSVLIRLLHCPKALQVFLFC
jgi:hypothetical protein